MYYKFFMKLKGQELAQVLAETDEETLTEIIKSLRQLVTEHFTERAVPEREYKINKGGQILMRFIEFFALALLNAKEAPGQLPREDLGRRQL